MSSRDHLSRTGRRIVIAMGALIVVAVVLWLGRW